jgi:hypothetical protein
MMKGIRIVQLLAPTSRMMLISASDEGRLPDRRRHEERGTDRHERGEPERKDGDTVDDLEELLEDLLLVLDARDAGSTLELAGDDGELGRVLEFDPEALRDVADLHGVGDGAVAELLTEPVEGLLGILTEDLVDLWHRFELALDRGLLVVGCCLLVAVRLRSALGAHVDRDLDPVVPVALHRVGLALGQHAQTEEEDRHHGDEDDRDGHREVAAQTGPDLAENETQAHQAPP